MGMTMTQKILAAHAGLESVKAGDLIEAKLDLVLGNDITTPVAITVFNKTGFTKIFDKDKIAIVLDHYTPCKDIKSAELCFQAREFAKRFHITHLYDVGKDIPHVKTLCLDAWGELFKNNLRDIQPLSMMLDNFS